MMQAAKQWYQIQEGRHPSLIDAQTARALYANAKDVDPVTAERLAALDINIAAKVGNDLIVAAENDNQVWALCHADTIVAVQPVQKAQSTNVVSFVNKDFQRSAADTRMDDLKRRVQMTFTSAVQLGAMAAAARTPRADNDYGVPSARVA